MVLILIFVLFLFFAALCTYLVERWILNTVPGDLVVPVIAGIIGAVLGDNLIGHFGPDLAGVSLIPCIIGSTGLVFVASLVFPGPRRHAQNQDYIVSLFKSILKNRSI